MDIEPWLPWNDLKRKMFILSDSDRINQEWLKFTLKDTSARPTSNCQEVIALLWMSMVIHTVSATVLVNWRALFVRCYILPEGKKELWCSVVCWVIKIKNISRIQRGHCYFAVHCEFTKQLMQKSNYVLQKPYCYAMRCSAMWSCIFNRQIFYKTNKLGARFTRH